MSAQQQQQQLCPNETAEDLAHRQSVRMTVQLFLLCVTPLLALLGVAANSVNIVVLTRKWMASSTNYYLTALAITDIVYLLIFYLITVKLYPGVNQLVWFAYLQAAMFPLANLFSNFATWLTCFFTFERWVAVYRPMLGRKYCTKERAKHTIGVIFLATVFFTVPNFLEYRVESRLVSPTAAAAAAEDTASNATNLVYYLGKTDAYQVMKRLGYYHLIPIVFIFGPLVFLAVFNSLLIGSVVRAKKKQEELSADALLLTSARRPSSSAMTPRPSQQFAQMPPRLQQPRGSACSGVSGVSGGSGSAAARARAMASSNNNNNNNNNSNNNNNNGGGSNRRLRASSEQQKITVMLIAVVIVFCLCQLPSAFVTLKKAVEPYSDTRCLGSPYEPVTSAIVNLLLLVNAACNFVLYSCFSTKFRKTFSRVFLTCGRDGGAGGRRGRHSDLTTMLNDYDRTPRCSESNIHELQMSSVKTCLLQVPTTASIRRVSY